MQQYRFATNRRVIVVAVLLLLACGAGSGLLGLRAQSAAARAESWQQAQRRWAAHGFAHYRVVMQAPSWCRMDLEIKDEQVVTVYQNSCPSPPLSVADLFVSARQLDSEADRVYCGPDGCECTERRFAVAAYDAQLGFPRTIKLGRMRAINWPELGHYMLLHGMPNCLDPRDVDVVNVISLQPLSP